ncbi:2-dehydro-3-deoxyphosphooctonate aldolase [Flavobacterium sp. CYK-4]|uniref:2-dehydro-3-deoxyphosphooctonate aldolase n=1 Tax=Flavobacterium lotistagni TaxID=2709660 RepID=UPI00140BEDAF|nr:2-dehydro-3-deoxyphosphooctonate aldolase [Flavobacterium lotistagni]NHM07680.1 2-dehydro-3-deoxyphosphooctonate aldolase [Flavobacterium lotistagni]
MKNTFLLLLLLTLMASCVSTKSTLKNVDEHALIPKLSANNTFVLTESSKDPKYGYDKDFPINVFYKNTKDENINQQRFLNALAGPNGETITYKKVETCCPFPTKNTEMGVGLLDIYEISWAGQKAPVQLYLNYFEKGALLIPVGFTLKK